MAKEKVLRDLLAQMKDRGASSRVLTKARVPLELDFTRDRSSMFFLSFHPPALFLLIVCFSSSSFISLLLTAGLFFFQSPIVIRSRTSFVSCVCVCAPVSDYKTDFRLFSFLSFLLSFFQIFRNLFWKGKDIKGGKLSSRVVSVIKVADGLVISRSALREPIVFGSGPVVSQRQLQLDNDKTGPKLGALLPFPGPAPVHVCAPVFYTCGRQQQQQQLRRNAVNLNNKAAFTFRPRLFLLIPRKEEEDDQNNNNNNKNRRESK